MFSQSVSQQDNMEVRALCFRLMMNVLFLLAARDEVCCSIKDDVAFPQVVPNRLQFFKDEPIDLSCEGLMGLTGWRVMKKTKGKPEICAGTWESSTGPCKIVNAFSDLDTGEYWCEIGAKRSGSVNITVTAGPVILESPVLPVDEGSNVTLTCRNKQSSPNTTAQFFKDGVPMGSSDTGTTTVVSVSRSQEGFYKCRIPGEGDSPESRLTVREVQGDPDPNPLPQLVWICIGVCVFLLVLLLLVGFTRHKKRPTVLTEDTPPSVQSPAPTQRVSEEVSSNDPAQTTYSFVDKPKKKQMSEEACIDNVQSMYAPITKPKKKRAPKETCTDDSYVQTTYSFIDKPKKKKASEETYPDDSMQSTYALINKPMKRTDY